MKTEQMMLETLRWNEGAHRDGAVQTEIKGGKRKQKWDQTRTAKEEPMSRQQEEEGEK